MYDDAGIPTAASVVGTGSWIVIALLCAIVIWFWNRIRYQYMFMGLAQSNHPILAIIDIAILLAIGLIPTLLPGKLNPNYAFHVIKTTNGIFGLIGIFERWLLQASFGWVAVWFYVDILRNVIDKGFWRRSGNPVFLTTNPYIATLLLIPIIWILIEVTKRYTAKGLNNKVFYKFYVYLIGIWVISLLLKIDVSQIDWSFQW